MWAYNVTRALLSHSGLEVIPEAVPKDEDQAMRLAFGSPVADGQICCIKVHRSLSPKLGEMRVVFTYRDVRDALWSYMRFMNCDFHTALPVIHQMMVMTDPENFFLPQPEDLLVNLTESYDLIINLLDNLP